MKSEPAHYNPRIMLALCHGVLEGRRRLGWNQTELARRSNVSRQLICEIEHGHRKNTSLQVAYALTHALGLSLDALFAEDGAVHEAAGRR